MEYENLDMKIGSEQPLIEAKKCLILSLEQKDIKDKEGKDIGVKLVMKVNHPDAGEIELSKVKYEKNSKLTESGLWLTKDKDGNIPFKSALASLLKFNNCSKLKDLNGKEINTAIDDNGFIIAKAY